MIRLRHAIACCLLLAAPALAAAPVPTVVVDIHARGAAGVAALKAGDGVRWSAEFGDELLLGVDASSLDAWLARDGVRRGPGALAFEEIVVRDHVCAHDEQSAPALAHVGGYEIVRMSPLDALATRGAAVVGEPLPADGVVSREVRNDARAVAPDGVDPFVAAVVARVDAQRWFDTVGALAAFNRNSFSPTLGNARDWLLARFGEAGLQTSTFTFDLNATSCSPVPPVATLQNPIGVHVGTTLPDEWIVVGAHYDSRNAVRCDGTVSPQPGANDNATGCAGVIELARAFQGVSTSRTIVFMCFAGEEQGLVGSRRYVESLQAAGTIGRVKHMVNLDMIGHAIDDDLDARIETTATHQAEIARYVSAAATYAPTLNLITSTATQANSDHWYFLAAGVPGAFTWENGAGGIYPQYHQSSDVPSAMQRSQQIGGGILRMDAAVIAGLAGSGELFADGFED